MRAALAFPRALLDQSSWGSQRPGQGDITVAALWRDHVATHTRHVAFGV